MTAEELLTYLSHQGIELWIDSDKLRYRGPKKSIPPNIVALLRHHKEQLRTLLRTESKSAKEQFPLSYSQKALWFLYQMNPTSAAYNVAFAAKLRGALSLPALRSALTKLGVRHPGLRTRYFLRDGLPWQQIDATATVLITVIDAALWTEDALQQRIQADTQRPFDLLGEAPARIYLYQRSAVEQVLFLGLHHIRLDGWAMSLLVRELSALYRVESAGHAVQFLPLSATYADFVAWQQQLVQSPAGQAQLAYWMAELSGELPFLELPSDRPRPPVRSERGARIFWSIDPELTRRLKALAVAEGTTLYTVLLAAFAALLHRYTGQPDLLIGSPFHGRSEPRWSDVLGYMVNTLVLRVGIHAEQSFRTLLKNADHKVSKALTHPDYPFPLLVEKLRPDRDPSRTPLFQVMFAYENFHGAEMLAASLAGGNELPHETLFGLPMQPFPLNQQDGQFDLVLTIAEAAGALVGSFSYSVDLFDAPTIDRMRGHWQNLLASVTAAPEQSIGRLSLLSPAEKQQLLAWNATTVAYRPDVTIHQLFEEQVARYPEAVAAVYEGQALTYRELNHRANQLAHHLREHKTQPDALVGLCVERSVEMVVGLLGILKAGAAYLPIDPDYPQARIAFMLQDAQPLVLLTTATLVVRLPATPIPIFCIDSDLLGYPRDNPSQVVHPEHLISVLFTSGSTGSPKGVPNTHRGIFNRIVWMQAQYQLSAEHRVLQKTPFTFDVAGWEFFWPLTVGARLIVARPGGHKDPDYLVSLIEREKITTLHFVPSMLAVFLRHHEVNRACGSLQQVFCSGEALLAEQVRKFTACLPHVELHNLYGPTEAAIDVSYYACGKRDEAFSIPIGRPIANMQLYVLDPLLQPTPIGVAGEIHIGGVGLARGYLNRPELTREKFIDNAFAVEPGSRLYKTGDLGRFLADGYLEFLGRIDHQVKLRGFRIELGEIESVLTAHPHVSDCAVLLREDIVSDQRLCAYVVPTADAVMNPTGLRSYLETKLPDYMIPADFVVLPALPVTTNGKLDRKALPAPSRVQNITENVALRSPIERLLAQILAEVLNLNGVNLTDNFFSLGGHSLLAMQLVARLRSVLGVELPVRVIFESPTLGGLAERVRTALATGSVPLPAILAHGLRSEAVMSHAQQRLWLLQALDPSAVTYNVPTTWKLSGPLEVVALQRSLNAIAQRHEVLRAQVVSSESATRLRILPHGRWELHELTVSSATEALQVLQAEAARPFVLESSLPMRAVLVHLSAAEHWLQLTVHHMAFDDWSQPILLRELSALYQAERGGTTAALPPLRIQYADYAAAQHDWLRGGARDTQLGYWKRILTPLPAVLELPASRPRPVQRRGAGRWCRFEIEAPTLTALKQMCRHESVTLFMALMSAYQITLSRYSGQADFAVGTPIAGRRYTEVEGLIGCFVNTLVMRADLSGDPTYQEVCKRVKEQALGAYAHSDLPFEVLVEALNPPRDTSRTPLLQVMFALQNTLDEKLRLADIHSERLDLELPTARFDLTLLMGEEAGRLVGILEYNVDILDRALVEQLGRHFQNIIRAVVATPHQHISQLPLLSRAERQLIVHDWNQTPADYPQTMTIAQLFEAQVEQSPEAVAVVYEGQALTYRELNHRANQLAYQLRKLGVGPDQLVGLCVERSLETVVGLVGILKAGGAYFPIDLDHPKDRITFMLEDARPQAILVHRAAVVKLPSLQFPKVLVDEPSGWDSHAGENPLSISSAQSLVYVLYTSGSTGRPKGVLVEHRSLINLLTAMRSWLAFQATDVLVSLAPLTFDIAGLEIWLPLLNGARVVLAPRHTTLNGQALAKLVADSQASVLQATPAGYRALLDSGWQPEPNLRTLVGGEALPPELADVLAGRTAAAWNLYGPTETTIYSTGKRLVLGERPITIGRPLANTQAYILDRQLQPVPIGVTGELHIGGAGLARGYLNRPELTAQKFITNPFVDDPQECLYKTGDRARFLPDGSIEYLGRSDNQVKLRGYRIELGEIESVLGAHPHVRSCVVLLREETPGDKRLCAYVVLVPGVEVTPADLRAFLDDKLPDYMIPAALIMLNALPLNPSGKIDRKALPAPDLESSVAAYTAPRSAAEQLLTDAFAQVLNLSQVGIHDNFFSLGGHSLLAVRLITRLATLTGRSLPLATLFQHPTVAELARELANSGAPRSHQTLVPLQAEGRGPPLFCVHPVGGHVLCYLELARAFDPAQRVYGLQATPIDSHDSRPTETLVEVASRYIAAIKTVQPHGPYQLLGWSMGGVLAFEMARQLRSADEPVAFLALLDSYVLVATESPTASDEAALRQWFLRDLAGQGQGNDQTSQGAATDLPGAVVDSFYALFRHNVQLSSGYRPSPYAGSVLLLRAAAGAAIGERDHGWAVLCTGRLEVVAVPGDHYTLLSPTHAKALAQRLATRLIR